MTTERDWVETTPDDGAGTAPAQPRPDELVLAVAALSGDVFYVLRVQPDVAFEYISPSVLDLVGHSPSRMVGNPGMALSVVDPRDHARLVAAMSSPLGTDLRIELRWLHRDGHPVWTQHRSRKRERGDGSVVLEGSARDITPLHDAQEALRASEAELRLVTDNVSDIISRTTSDGVITYISPSLTSTLGWEVAEWIGTSYSTWWHPDDLATVRERRERAAATGERARARGRVRTRAGDYRWMELHGRALFDPSGGLIGQVTVLRDVEDEVRSERALRESEHHYRVLTENMRDVVWVLDAETLRFTYVSPSVEALRGYTPEEVMAEPMDSSLTPQDRPTVSRLLRARLEAIADGSADPERVEVEEIELPRKDGSRVWTEVITTFHRNEETGRVEIWGVTRDISQRRRLQDEYQRLAQTDRLTGLLNRHELSTRLGAALAHPPRTGTRLAVLLIDVDDLKSLNDEYGHAAGDALLVGVARAIRDSVRDSDIVARHGDDEFVVVLTGVHDRADAERIASKVAAEVADRAIEHAGRRLSATVSIAVSLAEHGRSAEDVLRDAHRALEDAPRAGRHPAGTNPT